MIARIIAWVIFTLTFIVLGFMLGFVIRNQYLGR